MKKMLFLIMSIALTVSMISCGGNSSSQQTTQSSSSVSRYKSIYTALNDGSIQEGMTYDEIKEICGPAENVSRSNGIVEYVYYPAGGYNDVQLCFRGGRFYKWND